MKRVSSPLFSGFLVAVCILYSILYDVVFADAMYAYAYSVTRYGALRPYLTILYNYGAAFLASFLVSFFLLVVVSRSYRVSVSASSLVGSAIVLSSPVLLVSLPMILLGLVGIVYSGVYGLLVSLHYLFSLVLVLVSIIYVEFLLPWITPCLLGCRSRVSGKGCARRCVLSSKPLVLWVIVALVFSTLLSLVINRVLAQFSPWLARPLIGLERLVPPWLEGWRTRLAMLQSTMPRYSSLVADPVATIVYAIIYLRGVGESVSPRLLGSNG